MTLVSVMEVDLVYEFHSHDCPKCTKRQHCELDMCVLVWIPISGDLPKLGEDRLCDACRAHLMPYRGKPEEPFCEHCGSHLVTDVEQRAEYMGEYAPADAPRPSKPHDLWCFAELDI